MAMIQATSLHNYKIWQEKGFFLCDSFSSVNRLISLRRKPYRMGAKLLLNSWTFIFSFDCSGIVHFLLGVCEASNQNLYYIVIELRWQRLHWKVQCTDFASVSSKLIRGRPIEQNLSRHIREGLKFLPHKSRYTRMASRATNSGFECPIYFCLLFLNAYFEISLYYICFCKASSFCKLWIAH